MIDNDPFADFDENEQTQITKPTPGGRRSNTSAFASSPPPPGPDALPSLSSRTGDNRLELAAASVLNLLTVLKNTYSHADVGRLRQQLVEEIQRFDSKARELGISDQLLLTRARYVLCAALDDFILNTPWGQDYGWSQKTLQGTFFKDESAGKQFFDLLELLQKDPANERELLELIYICLALGFKGEYRVYNRDNELHGRRQALYQTLRKLRDSPEQELSPHWRGVSDYRNPIIRFVPLWVVAAIAALLLLLTYFFFYYRLVDVSDPLFVELQGVGKDITTVTADYTFPEPAEPPLVATAAPPLEIEAEPPPPDEQAIHAQLRRALLSEDCIDSGIIKAPDGQSEIGSYIRTNCSGLFQSGKWNIEPEFNRLLDRIAPLLAESLNALPAGRVLVVGYTDNIPGRFIDNSELSQLRADAVVKALVARLGNPGRFDAEGRGERQPVASNETPAGRAANRRVEILLLFANTPL